MLKTIDGENWTEYKIPSVVENGFYLISMSALDMDHLWVAGETFDPGNILGEILHTGDDGTTWESQDMPVDAMIRRYCPILYRIMMC